MWKTLRIILLLLVLAGVAYVTWLERARATGWSDTLHVAVYPINGDGSAVAEAYVRSLNADSFRPIERWFDEEGRRHGLAGNRLVAVSLAPPVAGQPPRASAGAGIPEAVWFSLRLRFWAWRNGQSPGVRPRVKLFVRYFDPALHRAVAHSVGLQQGLIGVINAFASAEMAGSNQVVIVHELLHTLGATDKYEPATNQPRFPDGYADPGQSPLLPQARAEVMGGRIPLSEQRAEIPETLAQTVVGDRTAQEIGWRRRHH